MSARGLAISLLAAASLLAGVCQAGAGPHLARLPLAPGGYVRYWLLAGPLAAPTGASAYDADLLAARGGEAAADPAAGDRVPGAQAEWTPRGSGDYVDLWAAVSRREHVAAYAFCALEAAAPMRVRLRIGSTDDIRVWLGGREVLARRQGDAAPAPDRDTVEVALNAGLNRLLVKSCQTASEWGFHLRVVALDGRDADVRVAVPAPGSAAPAAMPAIAPRALPGAGALRAACVPAGPDTVVRTPGGAPSAVRIAAARLRSRLRELGVASATAHRTGGRRLRIEVRSGLASAPSGSFAVQRQPGALIVRARDAAGMAAGISYLQARAWRDAGGIAVIHLDAVERAHIPAFRRRAVYVMLGYDLPGIAVQNWSAARWREYIDDLVLAQFNTLYLYIWTDGQSAMAGAGAREGVNRATHAVLREAVRYARRRGMDVIHMITPTLAPHVLLDTTPGALSPRPTVPGWKFACPTSPAARAIMERMVREEVAWFRDCTGFQITFFDPGGCLCPTCTRDMPATLWSEVEMWRPIVRQANPRAELSMCLWPFRVTEQVTGLTFARAFLHMVRERMGPETDICEAADIDRVYLPVARGMGLRTTAFIFPTNPETAYVLPAFGGPFWARTIGRVRERGFDRALVMRIEAASRRGQDALLGALLWDPRADTDAALGVYARALTGAEADGARLAALMAAIDRFTQAGAGADASGVLQLGADIRAASDALAPRLRGYGAWVAGLGAIYDTLGRALYAQQRLDATLDPGWLRELDALRERYGALLRSDPWLGPSGGGASFDQVVRWLTLGRDHTLF